MRRCRSLAPPQRKEPRATRRTPPAMARIDRLPWRVLAGLALTLIGLALGFLWFRDSSFAAVERVSITGSTSSEESQVRAALKATATGMSTLKVDAKALRESVEPFSS